METVSIQEYANLINDNPVSCFLSSLVNLVFNTIVFSLNHQIYKDISDFMMGFFLSFVTFFLIYALYCILIKLREWCNDRQQVPVVGVPVAE